MCLQFQALQGNGKVHTYIYTRVASFATPRLEINFSQISRRYANSLWEMGLLVEFHSSSALRARSPIVCNELSLSE
jgi:hypothetical protein